MTNKIVESYEAKYNTSFAAAPEQHQKLWVDAWKTAAQSPISIVETYRVSVGNSPAGELAAEWTMQNLREIRDELYVMIA